MNNMVKSQNQIKDHRFQECAVMSETQHRFRRPSAGVRGLWMETTIYRCHLLYIKQKIKQNISISFKYTIFIFDFTSPSHFLTIEVDPCAKLSVVSLQLLIQQECQ